MEEGPEPHEWIEKTVEHHHHGHDAGHEKTNQHFMMIPAITAAILAVCAALGSLLSGHAANEAILKQTEANDKWAYYQSNSTKGHLHEVGKDLVLALLAAHGIPQSDKTEATLKNFEKQVVKYDERKEEAYKEATHLEEVSKLEFAKHQKFALGVSSFQIGIVLASITLLVRYRILFALSLAAGGIGVICLVVGLLGPAS
jgi:hypothetical protein